ncbi:MAG: tetratricopeptide repeat protein [Promethearchaeota archaeon]
MADEINFREDTKDLELLFSPKSNYTFLVGAGISMDAPTNMPSAVQIVRSLLELCAPFEEVENLFLLEMLRFELVVEKFQYRFDEELKFLNYLEHIDKPNLIHLFLANAITRGNYVVTTNFDYLIEHALLQVLDKQWHQNIIPVITKEDFIIYQDPKSLIASNQYPVYKIHGSKRNIITGKNTKDSLITTISALGKDRGEGETFAIEPYKKSAVFNLMNNRTLVVMGYSGSDDFDIGPALKEMPFLNRIIWIEHCQDSITKIIEINRNEILKYKEKSSYIEQFVSEVCKICDIDGVLIRTNTAKFIKNVLWRIFLPYLPINEIDLTGTKIDTSTFSEWIKKIYGEIPIIEKYKFACQLFDYLKDVEATIRCTEKGISIAQQTNDIESRSYFLNYLGLISQMTGKFDLALQYYEESYRIDKDLEDISAISTDLNNIGSVYLTIGKYDEALDNYNKALEIVERLGDLSGKITCKNNIGRVYEIRNEFELAIENYVEAIKITEQVGDLNRKAALLNNVGMIHKARNELVESLKDYKEALRISDLLGDQYGKIILLNNIGRVYDDNNEYEKALEKYNDSLQIAEKLGDLSKKAGCINNIGSFFLTQGEPEIALEKYKEALDIEERLGDPLMKIIYLNNIGMIYNNIGNYLLAKENYSEALKIAGDIGDLSKKALLLTKIATIDLSQEKFSNALKHYEEAVLIFDRLGELSNKAASLSNIGRIYEKNENFHEALRRYEETLQIDQQLNDPMSMGMDYANIAKVYNQQGEYHKALQNYEEALKIFNQLEQKQYIDFIENNIKEINSKLTQ